MQMGKPAALIWEFQAKVLEAPMMQQSRGLELSFRNVMSIRKIKRNLLHARVYVCVYVHTYMYIYIYICVYIYIYIQRDHIGFSQW